MTERTSMSVVPMLPQSRAEIQKRYRQRRKARQATPDESIQAVTTAEIAGLAGRLAGGKVLPAELAMASRLLMALVTLLPRDGVLGLPVTKREEDT
jgi:hypothetical protein